MEENTWLAADFCPDLEEGTIYLRDPVYGLVPFTSSEMDLMSLPEVRRLSGIRQNSLLEYIFPGANHTRLQHSIGVAFLLDKIFCNTHFKKENETWDQIAKSSEFRTMRRFVRLAGLLHDIGHGPLSHASEDWLSILNYDLIKCARKHDQRFKDLKPHEIRTSLLIKGASGSFKKSILKCIFPENLDDIAAKCGVLEALAHFSVGVFDNKDADALRQNGRFGNFNDLRWLNRIINGDYDADRLDYHMRDPIFAGVSYGATDFSRFLRLTSIFEKVVTSVGDKGHFGSGTELAIEVEKGLGTLESIDVQRAVMYPYVYRHSTSRAINAMLIRAVLVSKQLIASHKVDHDYDPKQYFFGKGDRWPEFYDQTDYVFLWDLDNFLKKHLRQEDQFRYIVENVINRKIYKKIRLYGEYTPSIFGKRPLYLRMEEVAQPVIDRLEEISKENNLERLLLWCRRLEMSLEQYLDYGSIGPISDELVDEPFNYKNPYKYTPVIIDIPFLPVKSAKTMELKGIDRNTRKRNLGEYLKTRQAAIEIDRREWFIAFYGTEEFIKQFEEQDVLDAAVSSGESDIEAPIGDIGPYPNEKQKYFVLWLESFFLSQGDGLACIIEELYTRANASK